MEEQGHDLRNLGRWNRLAVPFLQAPLILPESPQCVCSRTLQEWLLGCIMSHHRSRTSCIYISMRTHQFRSHKVVSSGKKDRPSSTLKVPRMHPKPVIANGCNGSIFVNLPNFKDGNSASGQHWETSIAQRESLHLCLSPEECNHKQWTSPPNWGC